MCHASPHQSLPKSHGVTPPLSSCHHDIRVLPARIIRETIELKLSKSQCCISAFSLIQPANHAGAIQSLSQPTHLLRGSLLMLFPHGDLQHILSDVIG
jgi:hypothetical protein